MNMLPCRLLFSNWSFLFSYTPGFPEFEKVDILWKDAKSSKGTPNGLYLRVFMSENCDKTKFWSILVDSCLQIWAMIDWECSRPDDINDITRSYGVDAAVGLFRTVSFMLAISGYFISYQNYSTF